jgi:two-component system cell cycle sensor histidine kinase/response regulator CckA
MQSSKELPSFDFGVEDEMPARLPTVANFSTETIDLDQVMDDRLDESGSFEVGTFRVHELTKLFEAIPTPVFLIDQSHRIRFINRSCTKIDAESASMLGQLFTELFRKQHVGNQVRSVMARVFTTRRPQTVTGTISIGKGVLWGRIHFRSLRLGKKRYLLVLVEDLTSEKMKLLMYQRYQEKLKQEIIARRRAEQAIRRSEKTYRSLFENAPTGIMMVSSDGRVRFLNPACAKIVGYSQEDLKAKPFTACVHPADRRLAFEKHKEQRDSPGHATTYGCRLMDSAGGTRWVQIMSVSIEQEEERAILMFMEDVTQKRALEQEAAKVEKLESLGLLAGGIAHDFNNIITAILGNISLGKASLEALENVATNLASAERACLRAKGLTHQLLTFSKGGAPIKKVSDLGSLLNESCSFALRGSNVRCDLLIQEDLRAVSVDPGQMSQVFNNLIINADHAMADGGVMQVVAENTRRTPDDPFPLPAGEYVKVTFRDHGNGIPEHVLPRIFDPYFTTKANGMGLGLATAYSIVKSHDGVITVESSREKGTTFSIYLPASNEIPAPVQPVEDVIVRGTGKILIMDDEDQIRELAGEALSHLGYEVELAAAGAEAIQRYQAALSERRPFDAVILDLTVPGGLGGRETARRILQIDSDARLIVASGYSTDPIMADHAAYGFKAVVRKPYTVSEMSRTLHEVLRSSPEIEVERESEEPGG